MIKIEFYLSKIFKTSFLYLWVNEVVVFKTQFIPNRWPNK